MPLHTVVLTCCLKYTTCACICHQRICTDDAVRMYGEYMLHDVLHVLTEGPNTVNLLSSSLGASDGRTVERAYLERLRAMSPRPAQPERSMERSSHSFKRSNASVHSTVHIGMSHTLHSAQTGCRHWRTRKPIRTQSRRMRHAAFIHPTRIAVWRAYATCMQSGGSPACPRSHAQNQPRTSEYKQVPLPKWQIAL